MEKEFVPYELAVKLKELGFDEPCFAYYIKKDLHIYSHIVEFDGINASKLDVQNSKITENHRSFYGIEVTAPLWQQVSDWFREKHNLHYGIRNDGTYNSWYLSRWGKRYETYQEARKACLEKLIELVENENNNNK